MAPAGAGKFAGYPASLVGLPEALIFFCSFSSIKGRKEDTREEKKEPPDYLSLLMTTPYYFLLLITTLLTTSHYL